MTGTLAGYRTPGYEQGISVAGYHLHFIDQEHTRGGHAPDYRLDHGQIEINGNGPPATSPTRSCTP